MIDSTETTKSFVNEDASATITCPVCNASKIISVDRFKHRQHIHKVKCTCGHVFTLHLEFRKYFRKPTELPGTFTQSSHQGDLGHQITIRNLSINGVCFETKGIHDIQVGQLGRLVFTLDNRKQTVLNKTIRIINVKKNIIGAELIHDRAYDKELGFYLLK
jgi:hypothetical protein